MNAITALSKLKGMKQDGKTYQQIANHFGVNKGHIWRAVKLRELTPKLRAAMGLAPAPKPVIVTPCECGQVHTKKGCPLKASGKRRKRYTLRELPPDVYEWLTINGGSATATQMVCLAVRQRIEGERRIKEWNR